MRVIATLLPEKGRKYLDRSVAILCEQPDKPVRDVLPLVFAALWELGLKEDLEAALRRLRDDGRPDFVYNRPF